MVSCHRHHNLSPNCRARHRPAGTTRHTTERLSLPLQGRPRRLDCLAQVLRRGHLPRHSQPPVPSLRRHFHTHTHARPQSRQPSALCPIMQILRGHCAVLAAGLSASKGRGSSLESDESRPSERGERDDGQCRLGSGAESSIRYEDTAVLGFVRGVERSGHWTLVRWCRAGRAHCEWYGSYCRELDVSLTNQVSGRLLERRMTTTASAERSSSCGANGA